ncbi:hypothetical protein H072_1230 [Dactylellina haptotyla CBS 200.50]|uniref:Peptidase S8/S53 domain-containing protein n=1 Tax=Dactylellina haptotyla (strain CBS 200.50) TaxID=1284197 RepID=S8APH8_DACHA|nr:hypothetical protein H072_1230 [Dactylellina haptotyla CBS 200.50]
MNPKDPDEDSWVFTIRKGKEKDKSLDEIRKYISTKFGTNTVETREKWAVDHQDGVMWFYLKCEIGSVREIMGKWNETILSFSSMKDEFKRGEDIVSGVSMDFLNNINMTADKLGAKVKNKRTPEAYWSPRELCMISQNPGNDISDRCKYHTDHTMGAGVIFYVIDTSFAIHHKDFEEIDWGESSDHIFTSSEDRLPSKDKTKNPDFKIDAKDRAEDPAKYQLTQKHLKHGTFVLSKVVGERYGIAPNAKAVLVKVTNRELEFTAKFCIEALELTYKHIQLRIAKLTEKEKEDLRIILVFSIGIFYEGNHPESIMEKERLINIVRALSNLPYVAFVTATGNKSDPQFNLPPHLTYTKTLKSIPTGTNKVLQEYLDSYQRTEVSDHPPILGANEKEFPNLIIVGGVISDADFFGRGIFQTADFVRVSAPAYKVQVALNYGGLEYSGNEYTGMSGTSLAAPAVAGVLAVLISAHGYTIEEAKDKLYSLAYSRARDGDDTSLYPPVVYNGMGQPPKSDSESSDPIIASHPQTDIDDHPDLCIIRRRRLVRRARGGVTEETVSVNNCRGTPTATFAHITPPPPVVYNETLCQMCLRASGTAAIDGVMWIVDDCPCRSREPPKPTG